MQDLELDDRFWRDALTALARGEPAQALSARHAGYAALLAGIEACVAQDATLVGVRAAGPGQNGRLLSLITAAFLARGGARTLLVDLSPEVRWLERIVGEDLKEGMVDHTQYGVPLERCVRETAFPGLAVLTGGAHFLTGSPLDDPPAFRGALNRLRQGHAALVVFLPAEEKAADLSGIAALCDSLVAVETGGAELRLEGSEQAVIHLSGDPQAGEDLARLAHRFLGPLPSFLARSGAGAPPPLAASAVSPLPVGREEDDDDVAFLAAFEEEKESAEDDREDRAEVWRRPRSGRRGRQMVGVLAGVTLLAVAVVLLLQTSFVRQDGAGVESSLAELGLDDEPIPLRGSGLPGSLPGRGSAEEAGTMVPLMPGDTAAAPIAAGGDSAGGTARSGAPDDGPGPAGRPAPYSLHVGSFQDAAAARGAVERLRRAGYTAFLAPVSLPARGRWHRVYLGSFADSTVAARTLEEVLGQSLVPEGIVRATPWTFEIGSYPSPEAAQQRIAVLGGEGISAYAAGVNPVRVYAGAYASREEAELFARTLSASTAPAHLIRREL